MNAVNRAVLIFPRSIHHRYRLPVRKQGDSQKNQGCLIVLCPARSSVVCCGALLLSCSFRARNVTTFFTFPETVRRRALYLPLPCKNICVLIPDPDFHLRKLRLKEYSCRSRPLGLLSRWLLLLFQEKVSRRPSSASAGCAVDCTHSRLATLDCIHNFFHGRCPRRAGKSVVRWLITMIPMR